MRYLSKWAIMSTRIIFFLFSLISIIFPHYYFLHINLFSNIFCIIKFQNSVIQDSHKYPVFYNFLRNLNICFHIRSLSSFTDISILKDLVCSGYAFNYANLQRTGGALNLSSSWRLRCLLLFKGQLILFVLIFSLSASLAIMTMTITYKEVELRKQEEKEY